jgi:hypothetical protein
MTQPSHAVPISTSHRIMGSKLGRPERCVAGCDERRVVMVNICDVLDMLASVAREHGTRAADHAPPICLITELLTRVGLPVEITLGALVVLHRAQRSQDCDLPWTVVLSNAVDAASAFVDLVPDAVFDRATIS